MYSKEWHRVVFMYIRVRRRSPRTSYIANEWPYRGVTVLTEGSRFSQLLLLRLYLQRENREAWWSSTCGAQSVKSGVTFQKRWPGYFTALQVSHVGLDFSVPFSIICTCQRLIIETVHSTLPLSHQCDMMRESNSARRRRSPWEQPEMESLTHKFLFWFGETWGNNHITSCTRNRWWGVKCGLEHRRHLYLYSKYTHVYISSKVAS